MVVPDTAFLITAVPTALAAGTREAFESLLTEDVDWGIGNGAGHRGTGRTEAGKFYAGLLAAGIAIQLTDLTATGRDHLVATLEITASEPGTYPPRVTLRLTARGSLIARIVELGRPCTTGPLVNATHQAAVTAIHTGDLAALQHLLADQPDLANARLSGHGSRTLLHVATDWPGYFPHVTDMIATLIAAGADPNAAFHGTHAETPLHWAASSDDVAALDALLDGGAEIDVPGAVIGGGTPLADATAFAQWNTAHRLVERGARTSLFDAATLGLLPQLHQHLIEDEPTHEDVTSAFWGACHGGQADTASALLEAGADMNWIGYDNLTPLDAAQRSNADNLASWLENHGATTATAARLA